jgi:hypothetical protein
MRSCHAGPISCDSKIKKGNSRLLFSAFVMQFFKSLPTLTLLSFAQSDKGQIGSSCNVHQNCASNYCSRYRICANLVDVFGVCDPIDQISGAEVCRRVREGSTRTFCDIPSRGYPSRGYPTCKLVCNESLGTHYCRAMLNNRDVKCCGSANNGYTCDIKGDGDSVGQCLARSVGSSSISTLTEGRNKY